MSLIDRDALADELHTVLLLGDVTSARLADAAIAYLRDVALAKENLAAYIHDRMYGPEAVREGDWWYGDAFVEDVRAIFGDTE